MANRKLIEARKAKGWTQSDLAQLLAVSPTTVSRWENGIQVPHTYCQQRLCQMFNLTTRELGFALCQHKKRMFMLLSQKAMPLSALLAHPEVQKGMQDAHNAVQEGIFGGSEQEMFANLHTEEEIITFVDQEMSRRSYRRQRQICQRMGWAVDSYWYHVGFALAWLNQAMSYHQQQQAGSVHR